jgi:hypothetical protein
MLLFDLPPEIFGGDAHKDGHTVVGGEEVVKGVGIAKYLDERSLGIFAGSCRTARKLGETMQNDLPRMLMLYLVRLSPQMRALTTKSLLRNLEIMDAWQVSIADAALAVRTEDDMLTFAECALDFCDNTSPLFHISLEAHLPCYATVICHDNATPKQLLELVKTDQRGHPFWDFYADNCDGDRWHQMPSPGYVEFLEVDSLRILPELPHRGCYSVGPWARLTEPPRGTLWCGKIDVENEDADGAWGVIVGPHTTPWITDSQERNPELWTPDTFWETVRLAQIWF